MTLRDLFSVILKIMGIFFIRDLFNSLPQLLVVFQSFIQGDYSESIWSLFAVVMIFSIQGYIFYSLIFNTSWIIDKMKLTEDFDWEPIPFRIHRSTVIQIAVVVIGGLLLIDEIPNFSRRIFIYFQQRKALYHGYDSEGSYVILSVVKIILAVLILSEHRRIVSFILRKKNPGAASDATAE